MSTAQSSKALEALGRYQRRRRGGLAVLIAFFFGLLIFSGSLHDELTHERIESTGLALILVGIGGRLWSILYIGGRKSAELISTGPYSVMRNPLYFFSTIAVTGIGAQTGSLVVTVVSMLLSAAAFHIVALREERYLKSALGAPYQDYLQRVPRFLPNPCLFRDQPEVTFTPRIFNLTLRDGLMFLAAIPFFEFIEEGQENGLVPILLWLY